MVDVEDVNIIVDGDQEFEEEDGSDRNLNRKTDNMQDYELENKLKNLQIIDDQNLDMEQEDEDQHYPDQSEDEIEQQQELNYDQLGDIDPELLEAAQKLGLDEDGIRMLQQQMYQ